MDEETGRGVGDPADDPYEIETDVGPDGPAPEPDEDEDSGAGGVSGSAGGGR